MRRTAQTAANPRRKTAADLDDTPDADEVLWLGLDHVEVETELNQTHFVVVGRMRTDRRRDRCDEARKRPENHGNCRSPWLAALASCDENLDLKDLEIRVTTQDFQQKVKGYGLTTANILYRRPDHPWLLQSYVWQNYDLYPDFPELGSFLGFWQKSLEGVLYSVTVAHSRLVKPVEIKTVGGIFRLH